MHYFWDFSHIKGTLCALTTEAGRSISYAELNDEIDSFISKLPKDRTLVLLKIRNNFASVIAYLACLRKRNPIILVDADLNDFLFNKINQNYNPNLIIDSLEVIVQHSNQLDLADELAVMLSTSGSTGSPKLVRLSKDNLQHNADSIVSYLGLTSSDVAITTLPLHYSFGLSILNSHLTTGGKIVLTSESLISKDFWKLVQSEKVTSLSGVPYVFQMLRKMRYERFNTDSIRYLTQAGGRLDNETISYFEQQCRNKNQKLYIMYGQTEATARISYLPYESLADKLGSIGIAIPGGKLSIRDIHNIEISKPNIEGEIFYTGPNVMLGYAESLVDLSLGNITNGVLKTGDIGYRDTDGYFFITGRIQRFIKMYGLRISLDAVDDILSEQGFSAVATGKDDKLFIVIEGTDQPEMTDSIKTVVSNTLKLNINSINTYYVDVLPRTSSGKVNTKVLKDLMEQYEQS